MLIVVSFGFSIYRVFFVMMDNNMMRSRFSLFSLCVITMYNNDDDDELVVASYFVCFSVLCDDE